VTGKPLAILVNSEDPFNAKTAVGVLRYSPDKIVGLVDPERAGKNAADVYGVRPDVPIYAKVADLPAETGRLLVGIASRGGDLPPEMREEIVTAINRGIDIYNGLHTFITHDADLMGQAEAKGVKLVDLREVPEHPPVGMGEPHREGSTVILTVGSDCNVGKMSTALELDLLARKRGLSSTFIATGQTGIMIANNGIAVDRVISDFVNGAIEEHVLPAAEKYDYVWVEGQGSLFHPGYSCVTMGLLHGTAPEKMILCHQPSRTEIRRYTHPIPPLKTVLKGYEEAASWLRPGKVVGVALNTYDLDEQAAKDAVKRVEDELGIPATDAIRYGVANLLDAVVK
jgi:uncharacterized NAD-dependent epimerase/dehydratase family protein